MFGDNTTAQADVAPLVGAWIEIAILYEHSSIKESLLSWERGLKFCNKEWLQNEIKSLLSWERGLKSTELGYTGFQSESLLSWERGLKYFDDATHPGRDRRSSRGSVD